MWVLIMGDAAITSVCYFLLIDSSTSVILQQQKKRLQKKPSNLNTVSNARVICLLHRRLPS